MRLRTSHHSLLSPSRLTTQFLHPNRPQLRRYHRNVASPSYLFAFTSQRHLSHHNEQSKFSLPVYSPHPTPFKHFATITSTSNTSRASSSPINHTTEPSPISIEQFHRLSDAYIDALVVKLEAIQEKREDVDVEYSAGVLSLVFPPAGTYVLNKQPPNKQIWLSSPISGPKRYDWVPTTSDGKAGNWIYLRDGSALDRLLAEEIGISLRDD